MNDCLLRFLKRRRAVFLNCDENVCFDFLIEFFRNLTMFLLHNHHSVKREYDNRQIVFAPNVQVSIHCIGTPVIHRNSSHFKSGNILDGLCG